MAFERAFTVTLPIDDVINFCCDKDAHVQQQLRETYIGRCYKGGLLSDLVEVTAMSPCMLQRSNASGRGYVEVSFVAKVVVFSQWDILVGVEIQAHQQLIAGAYYAGRADPDAIVTLLPSKATESIALGQTVPVRVVLAQHPPMGKSAYVAGKLLTCDRSAPVYRLKGRLEATDGLSALLRAVQKEMDARRRLVETRKEDVWFFERLIYAYRPPPKAAPPPDSEAGGWQGPGPLVAAPALEDVTDVVRRAEAGAVPVAGYWSRPLGLYRSSPLAAHVEAPPAGWEPATEGTPAAVFSLLLSNILSFLTAVRRLVEVYDTAEKREEHLNVWTAMRSEQTPVE